MLQVGQHNASVACEFGVQSKYLDCERDFVGYALTGRLHLRPQFEIVRSVVEAITIFMMHVFAFTQWTSKHLCHYCAVLKFFFAAAKMQASISRRMNVSVFIYRTPSATFVSAFFGTKTLAFVVTGVPAIFGAAKSSFFCFAAKLTLKSRSWLLVHKEQLHGFFGLVKENVQCPSQA